jgi:hypothetical protein
MGVKELFAHLKENGEEIVDSVCAVSYLPQAILGVEIPKANGKKPFLRFVKDGSNRASIK